MVFGINGPERTPSVVPARQTSDGGAGNLGYFQQEKKKKKNDDEESDTIEFTTKKEEDETEEILKEEKKEPDKIGSKIKTFWFNIHGIFNEVIDNSSNEK